MSPVVPTLVIQLTRVVQHHFFVGLSFIQVVKLIQLIAALERSLKLFITIHLEHASWEFVSGFMPHCIVVRNHVVEIAFVLFCVCFACSFVIH